MAVPKRKKSKMRVRQRKGHIKAEVAQTSKCPNCGAAKRAHRACPECGYYDGEKVLTTRAEKKDAKKESGDAK
jgi:large subunit ribosomal protein L32